MCIPVHGIQAACAFFLITENDIFFDANMDSFDSHCGVKFFLWKFSYIIQGKDCSIIRDRGPSLRD